MAVGGPRRRQQANMSASWYTVGLPMTTYETILLEQTEGIATLTLNRPDKLNALNERLLVELHGVLLTLTRDSTVRALILTGAGKAFAAGADIPAMSGMSTAMAKAFADTGHDIADTLESAPFPCIAAVNGFALGGGCELAMACDFIYASDTAKFAQPEVNLGVIPGFGGTQRLSRRVGLGRARELCYTGDIIGAEEALRIGLVNAVLSGRRAPAEGPWRREEDLRQGTARHRPVQARHRARCGPPARAGDRARGAGLRAPLRNERPARGDDGVHREAPGQVRGPLTFDRGVRRPLEGPHAVRVPTAGNGELRGSSATSV